MTGWATIEDWHAGRLHAAADALGAQLKLLRRTESDLRDSVTPKEWAGQGAQAAARSLRGIENGVLHRVEEFAALQEAIDDAADRVKHLKGEMQSAREQARSHGFTIRDNGMVSVSDDVLLGPGAPPPDPAVLRGLEETVAAIVRAGVDVDADLARMMQRILDEDAWSDASSMTDAAAAGARAGNATAELPPKNATPEQNRAWWDALSPAQQKWLIAHKPALLGNRKGLPYGVRHDANVNRLASERARLLQLDTPMARQLVSRQPRVNPV